MFKLRLPSASGRERERRRLRLEFVRFRMLLENARAVLNLVDDGAEKLQGEYIFDRAYVVSLVDGVLERLGMLVFDAAVLAPEGGERLYRLHDRLRRYAREELLSAQAPAPGPGDPPAGLPWAEEPEFRLLSRALEWMQGPPTGGQPAVLDLLRETFGLVTGRMLAGDGEADACRSLEVALGGVRNCFRVFDLGAPSGGAPGAKLALRELESPALGLMLAGASEAGEEAGPGLGAACRHWRAVIESDYLSLRGPEGPGRLVVEASVSGHVDSDFVFVFAERPLELRGVLPPGFRLEKTANGAFAWIYDLPGIKVEESLSRLGRELFCPRGEKTA